MNIKILFSFVLITLANLSFSQDDKTQEKTNRDLLTVGGGIGIAGYSGDLTINSDVSSLSSAKPYYNLSIERRFGKILGIELAGILGKLSYNENNIDSLSFRNFESKFTQIGANFIFNFDNDIIMKKQSPFSPYFAAGFHLFNFKSSSDLIDKNGNTYNYWEDGSIRTVAELSDDATPTTPTTKRDHKFETPLKGTYSNSAFSIPLTFGLKWKITERVQGRIYGTYNILTTDWIDNINNDKKDKYFNGGFSLNFILRKKEIVEKKYQDVNFKRIDKGDKDKDGVIDTKDKCQGTRWDVKVDKQGCPLDADKDGVPDYLDIEQNTAETAKVDEEGQTITDSLIQARIDAKNIIVTERKVTFSEEATTETLNNIFEDIKERLAADGVSSKKIGEDIPENLKTVDSNLDGLISVEEMNTTFDGFFEGSNNLRVKDLHRLVNYFFEQ